jgi:hypothetical protein
MLSPKLQCFAAIFILLTLSLPNSDQRSKRPKKCNAPTRKCRKMQKNARSLANIDKIEFDREG